MNTPIIKFKDGLTTVSQPAELSSAFYTTNITTWKQIGIPTILNPNRDIVLPHSILKHTIYLVCPSTSEIADSISWIYDNTRGFMRYYPFCDNQDLGSACNSCYNVHFNLDIIYEPLMCYNNTSNASWYIPNGSDGSIDYSESHEFNTQYDCDGSIIHVLPDDPNTTGFPSSPDFATHLAPYTLVWGHLLNFKGTSLPGHTSDGAPFPYSSTGISNGIKHDYYISGFDINKINPREKEFYNPSETYINGSQTFPSGYTFRTVYGIYPLKSEVEMINALHWNLYNHLSDIPAPIKSNESPSIYHVQAPLTIDPCVRIMDADFIIESGGSVTYDPNQTYGNFTFSGNTSSVNAVSLPECNCKLKCYEPSFYDEKNILINSNTIWSPGHYDYINFSGNPKNIANSIIRIAGTLEVAPGCTLTLNPNCRIEFGHQGKIIIQPKGKLIINGTDGNPVILTSACELMWDGINLEKFQGAMCVNCNINDYRSQIIASYAIIENADIAVLSKGMTNYNTGKTNYPSGIITANNCTFRNNRIDLQFNPYKRFINQNPVTQGSVINNCFFETTQPLQDNIRVPKTIDYHVPEYHIYLNNVHAVMLRNNNFSCNTMNFAPDERGTGIYSENAYLMTGDLYPNTFEGLTEGIWASHTGTPDYVSIRGNTFTNCIHAAVLEGTLNSLIVHNTFNIPEDEVAYDYTTDETRRGYDKPVSLYLRECKGFRAEENTFNGSGTTPTDDDHISFGIVANSIGSNNNYPEPIINPFDDGYGVIYKNTFNNNQIALQSELNNRGSGYDPAHPAGTGLYIGCNDFNNSIKTNIKVCHNVLYGTNYGYLRNQGWTTIQTPRGCDNRFSGFPINKDIDITSYTYPFYYFYSANNQPNYRTLPNSDFIGFQVIPIFVDNAVYNCPSNFNGQINQSINDLVFKIEQTEYLYQNAENNYFETVNGGNTQLLLNMITASTPAGHIRNTLLHYSPYLSNEVLLALFDPNNSIPNGIIHQVLIANSPLSFSIWDSLYQANITIPQGISNQISPYQSTISEIKNLESNMDYLAFSLNMLLADLVRVGVEEQKMDSVIYVLEEGVISDVSENIFSVYIAVGDFEKADSVYSIMKDLVLDTNAYELTMHKINLKMLKESLTPMELDNSTIADIEVFVIDNPEGFFKAKALLHSAIGKKNKREPYSENSNNRSQETIVPSLEDSNEADFKVYPNPASNKTYVKTEYKKEFRCALYNQYGVLIVFCEMHGENASINIEKVEPGVYQLVIFQNKDLIQTEKIVIIK